MIHLGSDGPLSDQGLADAGEEPSEVSQVLPVTNGQLLDTDGEIPNSVLLLGDRGSLS
jgi:hypothetical protein